MATPPSIIISSLSSESDQPELEARVSELESTMKSLQASTINNKKVTEIEKALGRLEAEVELVKRDMRQVEKKKRDAKRTWSWLIKIVAKHAIINVIIVTVMLILVTRARRQQIWKYAKRLLIDWKYSS